MTTTSQEERKEEARERYIEEVDRLLQCLQDDQQTLLMKLECERLGNEAWDEYQAKCVAIDAEEE